MSPDGESVVTGAGDETLRFWNVFSKTNTQKVCLAVVATYVPFPFFLSLHVQPSRSSYDFES